MENNNKPSSKVLFSYMNHPDIKFETYEPGERIIVLLRAHPFTQLPWIIYSVFFAFLLFVSDFFIADFFQGSQIFLVNLFGAVFIMSYIWLSFLNWYFNVGIVSNRRVVDVDFYNLLYKEITEARMEKIEDVTIKSGGYFQSLFDYGTIFVQTAGTEANVEFKDVPHPSEAVKIINQLLGKKHGF
jgi:hypothetical protein